MVLDYSAFQIFRNEKLMLALSTSDALFTVTGIGPVLELIRRSSNFSISSVARAASVENSSVKRIESGAGTLKSITRVARALNTDISVIVTSPLGTKTLDLSELGDFIRETRESQDISKNKLAKVLDRPYVFVSGVEASVNPSVLAIDMVAKALHISTELAFVVNGEEFVPPVAPSAEPVNNVFAAEERWENLGEVLKKTRTDSELSKFAVA